MKRILLAALALAIISAASAAAASPPDINTNTDQSEPGAPGLEAEQYALEYGVTGDEAQRRLDRAAALKGVVQEIVAAENGRVAGWGLVHEPEFGGWVYLVGNARPVARDRRPVSPARRCLRRHRSDIYAR